MKAAKNQILYFRSSLKPKAPIVVRINGSFVLSLSKLFTASAFAIVQLKLRLLSELSLVFRFCQVFVEILPSSGLPGETTFLLHSFYFGLPFELHPSVSQPFYKELTLDVWPRRPSGS